MAAAPTKRLFRLSTRRGRLFGATVAIIGIAVVVATQLWDPSALRGSFDVGGRSLYLECVGQGSPTIVLEAGSGGDHTTWADVVGGVRGSHRTCSYDRANRGQSGSLAGVRSSADAAVDLHALLASAKIPPPYILVGHSLGGISTRLFAARYADEVVGIVLVDATPSTFVADACAIVDAAQCETFRSDFRPEHNDGIDIADSAAAIAAAAPLRAMPVIVLAANDHGHDGFAPDLRRAFESMWLGRQREVAESVDGGRLQAVVSGHNIQSLHPELVIGAISAVAGELAGTTR
jgi:pimeloyl-ACP methyl ester carboxylesterase